MLKPYGVSLLVLAGIAPARLKRAEPPIEGYRDTPLYEVQVLDSCQSKTYPDGQCAAIYGQSPPLVNACKPPGEWQSYDIIFESPRWNEQKELVKKAAVTVLHNGVVAQNHFEFLGITDGITREVPNKYGVPIRRRSSSSCNITTTRSVTATSGLASLGNNSCGAGKPGFVPSNLIHNVRIKPGSHLLRS